LTFLKDSVDLHFGTPAGLQTVRSFVHTISLIMKMT